MKKLILAAAASSATLVMLAAPAAACPNGYKRVWIQGNPVCRLDVGGPTKLKANTGPTYKTFKATKKVRSR